jgi:signal transduction histidine kinase
MAGLKRRILLIPSDNSSNLEMRTLIFAPIGRDAELMAGFVGRLGRPCHVVHSIPELCDAIRAGAGAAIVTEEVLKGSAIEEMQSVLTQQPSWSDFPLILLTSGGRVTTESERMRKLRQPLGNVLLVERPARPETLSSTLETALRGRQLQYQIRDQMRQAVLTQEALRRSEKLAVTGRLAASIAHEINNPLESVTNLLYLMRSETSIEQLQRYIQLAEQELARVAEITKHTLRFYKESNHPVDVDLKSVLDSVLTLYHSRLAAAGVAVSVETIASSAVVKANPGELRQVIVNIVGNALDAMRGGGHLRLRISKKAQVTNPGISQFRLSIADTGSGIPKNLLPSVFEPFITTKGETGTGLGLWVTGEIVKKNGWSIRVRSRTNTDASGTVFSITFPVCT